MAMILGLLGVESGFTWFGLVSLLLGLGATGVVAYWVYLLQREESKEQIAEVLERYTKALRKADEIEKPEDVHGAGSGTETPAETEPDDAMEPENKRELLRAIRQRGLPLDEDKADWKRKKRCPGVENKQGNLGWFVEDDRHRYFVHKGRFLSVRRAIPAQLLDAWEKESGLDRCAVRLDWQVGEGKGNHAWFITSYDGDVWSVYRGVHGTSVKKAPNPDG